MAYEKPVLIDDNDIEPAGVGGIALNIFWIANINFTLNGNFTANVNFEYNVNVASK